MSAFNAVSNDDLTDPAGPQISRASAHDFYHVRRLPIQLCHPATSKLSLKQLRMMKQLAEFELVVQRDEEGIRSFMALHRRPGMLQVKYFAVDRFALPDGSAGEMEVFACLRAEELHLRAIAIDAKRLQPAAIFFYRSRDYQLDGLVLTKLIH